MSLKSEIFARMFGAVGRGAVEAGVRKHYTKPEVRKAMAKRARASAEKCTPCAAANYVNKLAKDYGNG